MRALRIALVLLLLLCGIATPASGLTAGFYSVDRVDDSTKSTEYLSTGSPEVVPVPPSTPNVSVRDVTIWRTTENATTFETVDEVESSVRAGTLSRAENLSGGGTMIIRFQIPGFNQLLAQTNGTNTTDRFQRAARQFGDLDFQQTNPYAQIRPVELFLLDDPGVRVLDDVADDTYYMIVDLQRVHAVYGSSDSTTIQPRARFTLNLTFEGSVTASGDEVVAEAFVPPNRVSINQTDGFVVEPGENLTVTGTANFGPFEQVQVVLQGHDDPATAENESVRRVKIAYLGQPIEVANGTWSYSVVFERTGSLRAAQNLTVQAVEGDGSATSEHVPVEVVTTTPTATETATNTATEATSTRTQTVSPTDQTTTSMVASSETASATSSERSSVTESAPSRTTSPSAATTGSTPGFDFATGMFTLVVLLGVGRLVVTRRKE